MRSPVAALAGNRVASRVDAARLTTAFTVLLIAVAAYSCAGVCPGWCEWAGRPALGYDRP
jgi:uncharacterized membrane protein YfcA